MKWYEWIAACGYGLTVSILLSLALVFIPNIACGGGPHL